MFSDMRGNGRIYCLAIQFGCSNALSKSRKRKNQGGGSQRQWGGLGKEKRLRERRKGRVSVKSKLRGLNKASGPQKAELSDILINNRSSIKGRLIGQRKRDCSALAASPLRSDSTLWDRVRRKGAAETDGRGEWQGKREGQISRQREGAEQTIEMQLQRRREAEESEAKFFW